MHFPLSSSEQSLEAIEGPPILTQCFLSNHQKYSDPSQWFVSIHKPGMFQDPRIYSLHVTGLLVRNAQNPNKRKQENNPKEPRKSSRTTSKIICSDVRAYCSFFASVILSHLLLQTSDLVSSYLRNREENLPNYDMNELKMFALRPMHIHLAMNCRHLPGMSCWITYQSFRHCLHFNGRHNSGISQC